MSTNLHESSVAIITGASRGIGLATAVELARSGWRIAMIARNESDLHQAARDIAMGDEKNRLLIPIDVSKPESAETIVARVVEHFGRIDALVNNAGSAPLLSIEETTPQIWRETIDTNLSATFLLCRACWPVFKRQGGGVIVNVSSVAARDPFAGFFAYGAAKAGVNNLGISLAREGAASNIRVHTVAPGATETAMFRALPGMSSYPKEKMLEPAQVARVVVQCIRGELVCTSGEVIYLHRDA